MEAEFWHSRWSEKRIGFHQPDINADLVSYWPNLGVPGDSRVLVPLCGKSLDMVWLAEQGHHVVGLELSEIAVREFFEELGETPKVETVGNFVRYTTPKFTILCGDFFDTTAEDVGAIGAIYDRAALVAMPPEMRGDYASHLVDLVPRNTPMLLLTFEYAEECVQGPPFSIDHNSVIETYQDVYSIELLNQQPIEIRGAEATELAFRLR